MRSSDPDFAVDAMRSFSFNVLEMTVLALSPVRARDPDLAVDTARLFLNCFAFMRLDSSLT